MRAEGDDRMRILSWFGCEFLRRCTFCSIRSALDSLKAVWDEKLSQRDLK